MLPAYWLNVDDEVVRNRPASFFVDTDDPTAEIAGVRWDFDYNGATFTEDAVGGGSTHTYPDAGFVTVAAMVQGATGPEELISVGVDVGYPTPVVVPPPDLTVTAGSTVSFSVGIVADGLVSAVDWSASYFNGEYEPLDGMSGSIDSYTFDHWGEYDVWVQAADEHGGVGGAGFHVSVNELVPDLLSVTVVGTVDGAATAGATDEGTAATFTVNDIDPDALDTLTLFADWTGSDEFDEVDPEEYTYDEWDRTISFTHVYDGEPKAYTAAVRVEDDGGQQETGTAAVTVNRLDPEAVLRTSFRMTTLEDANLEIWVCDPGDTVRLEDVTFPTEWEEAGAKYHFRWIDGLSGTNTGPLQGLDNALDVPEWVFTENQYRPGRVYEIEGWVTARSGAESEHRRFTFMMTDADPWGPRYENWGRTETAVWGGGFGCTGPEYGLTTHAMGRVSVHTGVDQYDLVPPARAAIGGHTYIFKRMESGEPGFNRVHVEMNPLTVQFAQRHGYTVWYQYTMNLVDLSSGQVITRDSWTATSPDYYIPVLSVAVPDRALGVQVGVGFAKADAPPPEIAPGGEVGAEFGYVEIRTPESKSWFDEAQAWVTAVYNLSREFGSAADAVLSAIWNVGPERFLTTVYDGLVGGVRDFINEMIHPPEGQPGLRARAFQWLLGGSGGLPWDNIDWADESSWGTALLSYAGLTWDKVYQIVRDELGDGNLAALERVFGDPDANPPFPGWFDGVDPTNPRTILSLLNPVGNSDRPDLSQLRDQAIAKVKDEVDKGLRWLGVQLAARLNPAVGGVFGAFKAIEWILANQNQLVGLKDTILGSLQALAGGDAETFRGKLKEVLDASFEPALSFFAAQFGLGQLPAAIRRSLEFVPLKVDEVLRKAVRLVAAQVPNGASSAANDPAPGQIRTAAVTGGTKVDPYTGMMGKAREFTYRGRLYRLFVAQDASKDGGAASPLPFRKASVKVVDARANKLVKVLEKKDFKGTGPQAALDALVAAAKGLAEAVKPRPQAPPTANTARDLGRATAAVTAAEDAVIGHIFQHACLALGVGCFAAGTKLWTPAGFRNVEDIRPGELVYSRDEHDPAAAVEPKAVEEVFRRSAGVVHLHVGGQVIRTTHEHPFYTHGRGWAAAQELAAGDWVLTEAGEWKAVGEVYDTGEWGPVYNLRVADHHTYFVGHAHWGWAAWAHNAICGVRETADAHNVNYTRSADEPAITNDANAILQAERASRNMPVAGSAVDNRTLAYVEVGGHRYFAANNDGYAYNWPSVGTGPNNVPVGQGVNPGARVHAEVKAMVHAVQSGASFAGQNILIFTDRDPCSWCDKGRGIENAARILGAASVTIWCPSGKIGAIQL